jgi:hypothetical protein
MRDILFPSLLNTKEPDKLSRDQLSSKFVEFDKNYDESKVGFYLSSISSQLGMKKNDFFDKLLHTSTHGIIGRKITFQFGPNTGI